VPTGRVSGFAGHRVEDDGTHGSVSESLSRPGWGDGEAGDDGDCARENGFHDHVLSTMNYTKLLH